MTVNRASSDSATLTVRDSYGTWDVVLEAPGGFRFAVSSSNTGWYRLRKRTIANAITQAYEEWQRWKEATDA